MTHEEHLEDILGRLSPSLQRIARSFWTEAPHIPPERRVEIMVSAWFGGEDPTEEPEGLIKALLERE